jgi:hypothetical protein
MVLFCVALKASVLILGGHGGLMPDLRCPLKGKDNEGVGIAKLLSVADGRPFRSRFQKNVAQTAVREAKHGRDLAIRWVTIRCE